MPTTISGNIFIVSAAIITAVISQLLFKKGMTVMGGAVSTSFGDIINMLSGIFKNPYILSGMFLYGLSFVIWLVVLSRIKLSLVYPITSLNFVFVIVLSYLFLGEKLSLPQVGAITIILIGVLALAKV